jgi:hypothetical protein
MRRVVVLSYYRDDDDVGEEVNWLKRREWRDVTGPDSLTLRLGETVGGNAAQREAPERRRTADRARCYRFQRQPGLDLKRILDRGKV